MDSDASEPAAKRQRIDDAVPEGGGGGPSAAADAEAREGATSDAEALPSAEEETPEEKTRRECLEALSAKDSIMDINVLGLMKKYIQAKGKPGKVVESISENYRGYGHMANLMVRWLQSTGLSEDDGRQLVVSHVHELVKRHFDPKSADQIFKSKKGAPSWLNAMTKEASWRKLLYELSEEHQNCFLLNFAVQHISQAGYRGEVASVSSAATYFNIFNEVLFEFVRDMKGLDGEPKANEDAEFKKMCCSSLFTFLYCQVVLGHLVTERNANHEALPNMHTLRRLQQDLYAHATDKHGHLARRIHFILLGGISHPQVASSVLSVLLAGVPNPSDIDKLHRSFHNMERAPPVALIRHARLLQILVTSLCNPLQSVAPAMRDKLLYLLAYASCVHEGAEESGERGTVRVSVASRERLTSVVDALDVCQHLCEENPRGLPLRKALPKLRASLTLPVVSMCVAEWIRANLCEPVFYNTNAHVSCVPLYLDLVHHIADLHPLHHAVLCALLVDALHADTSMEALATIEVRKQYLDELIHLMSLGHVMPVMRHMRGWCADADHSLVRYFVTRVLEMVYGPYSHEFGRAMADIVRVAPALCHGPAAAAVNKFLGLLVGHNIITREENRAMQAAGKSAASQ